MRTELRGVLMAGNLAEELINKSVGWGFHPNSNNLVLHEAKTRMNSAFAGGGRVSNFKPHKAFKAHEVCSYTQTSAKEVRLTPITSSRSGLRARQTKNFRLAGSQTKIRRKLKSL